MVRCKWSLYGTKWLGDRREPDNCRLTAAHHRSIFGASITLWLQHTNLVAELTKHTNYHRIVTEKIPNNGK